MRLSPLNVLHAFVLMFVLGVVLFCTGHFVMVPINLTYLHSLQYSFFEHIFNLYYCKIPICLFWLYVYIPRSSVYLQYAGVCHLNIPKSTVVCCLPTIPNPYFQFCCMYIRTQINIHSLVVFTNVEVLVCELPASFLHRQFIHAL